MSASAADAKAQEFTAKGDTTLEAEAEKIKGKKETPNAGYDQKVVPFSEVKKKEIREGQAEIS
jgi:hypothetical protein